LSCLRTRGARDYQLAVLHAQRREPLVSTESLF
jgi:hypothetical protein